jgi:ATP-binding cassette subfamily B protein
MSNIIFMSFMRIIMLLVIVPRAAVCGKRINEVLNTQNSIQFTNKGVKINKFEKLEFKNVSFKYSSAKENVINNVNFSVNKGETIAFIGSTGSGKTTLISLLPRFYDPTNGEILINNQKLKDISREELSDLIGYVPQKASLFNRSIRENISFGKKANIKQIKLAANIACASDFVEKLEHKYDTKLSQNATNVSGGQKQRISIARAICKKPQILLFDDSFSALDYKTDSRVRENIKKHFSGVTKMIVATRINSIIDADKIVVLQKGKILDIGNHKTLLKRCSEYKNIYDSQIRS